MKTGRWNSVIERVIRTRSSMDQLKRGVELIGNSSAADVNLNSGRENQRIDDECSGNAGVWLLVIRDASIIMPAKIATTWRPVTGVGFPQDSDSR